MSASAPYVDTDRAAIRDLGYYAARQRAEDKYRGCDSLTEMYYPKMRYEANWTERGNADRTVTDGSPVACTLCDAPIHPSPRRYRLEKMYCVSCLSARWFATDIRSIDGIRLETQKWSDCPVEVLGRIALYFSEYKDFASFSQVSRTCFEAANGDSWYESELTACKRFTIQKAIFIARRGKPGQQFDDSRVGEFSRRLAVGNIMGEFMESGTTEERKLRLVGVMVGTPYVARICGIKGRLSLLPPVRMQFTEITMPEITASSNISRDAIALKITSSEAGSKWKTSVLRDSVSGCYTAEVATPDNGTFYLRFDDATAMLTYYGRRPADEVNSGKTACGGRTCVIA